jgi:hypothetical protein
MTFEPAIRNNWPAYLDEMEGVCTSRQLTAINNNKPTNPRNQQC